MHQYLKAFLLSSTALMLLGAQAHGQAFPSFTIPDRSGLTGFQYLTQTDFATGTKYANTTIGGLSGIDFNPVTSTFISESDHAAAGEQTHYFTLAPVFTAGQPGYGIAFTGVHTLGPDDLESIRYDPSGNGVRVTAEGIPPHIYLYPANGTMSEWPVPNNIATRAQINSSFEGSTFTPNGGYFVSMENALVGDATDLTRLTSFNKDGSVAAQYVYPLDKLPGIANPPQVIGGTNNGVSDILALSNTSFLVMERAFNGVTTAPPGTSTNSIRIYEVDVTGATDVQTIATLTDGGAFTDLKKTLIFDSASLSGTLNTLTTKVDNLEGMSFGPVLPDGHDSIILINDNNYSRGQAKTQFLVFKVVTPIPDTQYWDGATPMADGKAGGGSGVWTADPTIENWTRAGGLVNDQWNAHAAVFGTIGGAVRLDASAGPIFATALTFDVGGYSLVGDALTPAAASTPIDVVNAGDAALIASRLTGANGIAKTGDGTLVLTAANDLTGATDVAAGRLVLADGGSLAASATTIAPHATLAVTGGNGASSVASLANDGALDIRGSGRVSTGAYAGGVHSTLQVNLTRTGTTIRADRLVVTGATGRTAVVVSDHAGLGAYDPTGTPIVVSTGPRDATNASNFYLAGGPIQAGLFQYQLAYRPDPAFVLVSTPGKAAFQIATLPAATQQIWFDTLGLWLDRQADLRDTLAADDGSAAIPAARAGSAAALAQDAVATSTAAPGIWARAVGSFTSRGDEQNVSVLNLRNTFDVGYRQDTGGVYGGLDGTGRGLLSPNDALSLGITAGYLDSTQTFHGAGGAATYEGGSVGATATYYTNRFFVDALFKADVLSTRLDLSGLGGTPRTTVTNTGGAIDAGYRLPVTATIFAEPLAALAYVATNAGSMTIAGAAVGVPDASALRGKLGGRIGTTMLTSQAMRLEVAGEAAYWDRLAGNAAISIGGGGPSLTLADHELNGYGEVGLGLSAVSLVNGLSGFLKADYRFANAYSAGTLSGGVRYAF